MSKLYAVWVTNANIFWTTKACNQLLNECYFKKMAIPVTNHSEDASLLPWW